MVSTHSELNRAQRLLDNFTGKVDDFDNISSLSEALGIISDVRSSSDEDHVRKVADNLVKTCKRNLIPRITYAVSSPKECLFEQLDYWEKICDEFVVNNFDDAQEFGTFQDELRKHKKSAEEQLVIDKRKALIESHRRDMNALEAFMRELEAQDIMSVRK